MLNSSDFKTKYLLFSEADVQAQTGTGDTALTYACENGHTDVAEVLLQHGAVLVGASNLVLTFKVPRKKCV